MTFSLRPYQQKAVDDIRQAYLDGNQGVLFVLPTGGGKTIIFSHIAQAMHQAGKKAVILAHREELVWQASQKLTAFGVDHGIYMGSHTRNNHRPIQVCSIDSMRNRQLFFEPDLIIIDEAHLIRSKRYHDFIERYPNAWRLLVTATPFRLDRKGFDQFASTIVTGPSIQDLIALGYLVPPRYFTTPLDVDLSQIKKRGGDYDADALGEAVSDAKIVGDLVDHYVEHANGKRAVCFCVSVKHAEIVAKQFNDAGVKAEALSGSTASWKRRQILQRLHSGDLQVVCNCNVLCEGWDEPLVECVILARPTESMALYIQQVGRGLRVAPEIGKTHCVILDHSENIIRHGKVEEPPRYTLEGFKRNKSKSKPDFDLIDQDKLAEMMGQELMALREQLLEGRDLPAVEDGKLVSLDSLPPQYLDIFKRYADLKRQSQARGYKKGWVWWQLKQHYHPATLIVVLGSRAKKEIPASFKNSSDYGDAMFRASVARSLEEALSWSAAN